MATVWTSELFSDVLNAACVYAQVQKCAAYRRFGQRRTAYTTVIP